jgi:hypothetical protein
MCIMWAVYGIINKAIHGLYINNICQYTSNIWGDIQVVYELICGTIYLFITILYTKELLINLAFNVLLHFCYPRYESTFNCYVLCSTY